MKPTFKPTITGRPKSLFLVAGFAALAAPAYSAILVSETEFGNSVGSTAFFTSGTSAPGTYYYDGPDSGPRANGGNPGAYLSIGLYENGSVFGLEGLESLQSVAFSLASVSQYSNFQLRIYGLMDGEVVRTGDYNDTATSNPTTGLLLYSSPGSATTGGSWTEKSYDLSGEPGLQNLSGYDTVAFKLIGNFDNPAPHGIDNFVVNGTLAQNVTLIPEPSSAVLLLGGVALAAGIRRRK